MYPGHASRAGESRSEVSSSWVSVPQRCQHLWWQKDSFTTSINFGLQVRCAFHQFLCMFLLLTQTGFIHQNCFLFRHVLKPTALSIPGEICTLICKEIMALLLPFPDICSVFDFGNGQPGKGKCHSTAFTESAWLSLVTWASESYSYCKAQ